jgi:hypothetical protein
MFEDGTMELQRGGTIARTIAVFRKVDDYSRDDSIFRKADLQQMNDVLKATVPMGTNPAWINPVSVLFSEKFALCQAADSGDSL